MAVTRPVVTHLACEHSVRSTGISLSGYTFMSPATDLSVSTDQESLLERYDYPGRYTERSRGESYARIRLEEERMRVRVLCGTATDRRLASGHIYTLTDHPRDDLNTSYLLTAVHHTGSRRGTETTYECGFECIPAAVPFRPESITPKPVISGCQTAVVAGPAGEEVWIDKYGRVKVRFHWDRQGRCDERSSCWVRVAQNWAGRNWGMVFHPRIGQEVVVQFLEGDPDRPLITGRVYNEEQMPPYELPANGSRSTIKSRSTPRGEPDNFNEIRFEDKKGEEQVFVQAEKDHVINVKNDQSRTVGNNRSTMIGNDESLDIKGSRAETIAKDETVSVGGDRHTAIDGTDTLTIKGDHSIKVGEGSQTIEVGANRAITISGNRTISVEGDQAGTVAGTLKSSAGGDMKLGADGNITIEAAGNVTIKAGGTLTIEASRVKVAGEVGVCSQDAGGGKMELAGGTAAISGTVVKLN
jgi:type VI secretion system secreted protein VgrG